MLFVSLRSQLACHPKPRDNVAPALYGSVEHLKTGCLRARSGSRAGPDVADQHLISPNLVVRTPQEGNVAHATKMAQSLRAQEVAVFCLQEPIGMASREPVRVLIVEDEKYSRRALGRLLRSFGYRVALADSAEQALEILRVADPPDAVLLDIELPGMDGLKLLELLRSQAPQAVPVIVSAVDCEYVRAATRDGVNFVRKPVDLRELLSVLGDALQTH